MYTAAVSFAGEYRIEERCSQSYEQQIDWNNIPSKTGNVCLQEIQKSILTDS